VDSDEDSVALSLAEAGRLHETIASLKTPSFVNPVNLSVLYSPVGLLLRIRSIVGKPEMLKSFKACGFSSPFTLMKVMIPE